MLQRMWRKRNPLVPLVGMLTDLATWRMVWRFLKTLGTELPYDPIIPLLGIYTQKTITGKDTCTSMFITAVFTIARTWKQPRCPWTDEWIKKVMEHIENGILLSHKMEHT